MKKNVGIAMKIAYAMIYCYNHKMKFVAKCLYAFNYIVFGCIIPPSIKIGRGNIIAHSLGIVMNSNSVIGNNCVFMHNVTLGNANVVIGDNCFLGCNCCIQGPCRIGNNVTIGANCYVDFDVPDNSKVIAKGVKGIIILKS